MAAAYVQSNFATADTSATTIAVTLTNPVAAGNTLVVGVTWDTTTTEAASVTDNRGDSYTEVTNARLRDTTNNQEISTFYAPNVVGGSTTITATLPASRAWRRIIVHEVSGLDPVSPLGLATAANPTSGTSVTSGTVTTAVNGSYIFGFAMMASNGSTDSWSAGSGFTLRANTGGTPAGSEDQIQAVAGTIAATFARGISGRSLASVATFTPLTGNQSSRIQDVRITAISGPNQVGPYGTGTFGYMLFGQQGTQTSVAYDARITGRNASNRAQDARVTGQASTSTTQTTAITAAAVTSFIVYESRLTGQATTSRAQDARLTAGVPVSIAYDSRLTGQAQDSRAQDTRIISSGISNVTYAIRQTGQALSSTTLDARITTQNTPSVTYDIHLTSQATTSVFYAVAETGQISSNRTQDVRQTARLTSSIAYDARLVGSAISWTAYDVRTIGQSSSSVTYSARATGQAVSQATYDAKITGQPGVSNVTQDIRLSAQSQLSVDFVVQLIAVNPPQIALPIADNFLGTWHDAPLWQKIQVNDGDFIESALSPTVVDVCEVQLDSLNDPLTSGGHIVRYTYEKSQAGGDRIDLVVRLMQGGTQIAAWSHADIGTITSVEQVLTAGEADSITDYSNLQLRFEAIKV